MTSESQKLHVLDSFHCKNGESLRDFDTEISYKSLSSSALIKFSHKDEYDTVQAAANVHVHVPPKLCPTTSHLGADIFANSHFYVQCSLVRGL